jgi:hypothetical protein
VQVACQASAGIAVRDSRDPSGPRHAFTAVQWAAFTGALKQRAAAR